MPKLKTYKALAKRVKLTKTGKLLHRAKGQDHFNTRATGKVTRNKRRDQEAHSTVQKSMKKYL